MIRIALYQWLPIANNMMPEIYEMLSRGSFSCGRLFSLTSQYDPNQPIDFSMQLNAPNGYIVEGRINNRGFAQHQIVIQNTGEPFHDLVGEALKRLRGAVSEVLLASLPIAVINKLAVLEEGIRSIELFRSPPFDPNINVPAKQFLLKNHIVVVSVDKESKHLLDQGVILPGIPPDLDSDVLGQSNNEYLYNLQMGHSSTNATCIANKANSMFLVVVDEFSETDKLKYDAPQYQLCAIYCLQKFALRTVDILKDVRSHAIPIRRQMSLNLQAESVDASEFFNSAKNYLAYVNIKLPVVGRVLNHIKNAVASPEFAAKLSTFFMTSGDYIIITEPKCQILVDQLRQKEGAIKDGYIATELVKCLDPITIIKKWNEDIDRASTLWDEDKGEIEKLSDESSMVLQGTILSKSLNVDERRLDTAQAVLELDRVGKNRANALKLLSIVLSITVVFQLYSVYEFNNWIVILLALVVPTIAYIFVEWYIHFRSSSVRIVMPFDVVISNPNKFNSWTDTHKLKRRDANGSRRIRTWEQTLYLENLNHQNQHSRVKSVSFKILAYLTYIYKKIRRRKYYAGKQERVFSITVDYDKIGFLYSMTIETECNAPAFSTKSLMYSVFELLHEGHCLELIQTDPDNGSIVAYIYHKLKVQIEDALPSLVRLLASPTSELTRLFAAGVGVTNVSLTPSDLEFIEEFKTEDQIEKYLGWFYKEVNQEIVNLLGEKHVKNRIKLLEAQKDKLGSPKILSFN